MSIRYINKVIVRNKLTGELRNVRVLYGQSVKSTDYFSYATDWRNVDIESGYLLSNKTDVNLPDVLVDQEASVSASIPFTDGYRGYWQVYFEMGQKRYKINKNNAQANPWPNDDGKYVEITIRLEGEYIRLDFVMNSGNAYFYAMSY